jgi:hypothetical protein
MPFVPIKRRTRIQASRTARRNLPEALLNATCNSRKKNVRCADVAKGISRTHRAGPRRASRQLLRHGLQLLRLPSAPVHVTYQSAEQKVVTSLSARGQSCTFRSDPQCRGGGTKPERVVIGLWPRSIDSSFGWPLRGRTRTAASTSESAKVSRPLQVVGAPPRPACSDASVLLRPAHPKAALMSASETWSFDKRARATRLSCRRCA